MRPRHYCRGRGGQIDHAVHRRRVASMRPRHYCRGRELQVARRPSKPHRFNEAAALLPRKRQGTRTEVLASRRASMRPRHYCRGRGPLRSSLSHPRLGASMRPRHYCRGRGHQVGVHTSTDPIASMRPPHYCRGRGTIVYPQKSWHCWSFNEAAALLPRKSDGPCILDTDFGSFNEAAALLPRKRRDKFTQGAPRNATLQ